MSDTGGRIRKLKARTVAARDFPKNTCAASRHVEVMARGLLSKRGYSMLADEREHCAESLLAVVAALWETRTEVEALRATIKHAHETARAYAAAWWSIHCGDVGLETSKAFRLSRQAHDDFCRMEAALAAGRE